MNPRDRMQEVLGECIRRKAGKFAPVRLVAEQEFMPQLQTEQEPPPQETVRVRKVARKASRGGTRWH